MKGKYLEGEWTAKVNIKVEGDLKTELVTWEPRLLGEAPLLTCCSLRWLFFFTGQFYKKTVDVLDIQRIKY